METTAPTFRKLVYHNAAGVAFNSSEQAASIFTLSALFKDGNKCRNHSWRQEIRTVNKLTDQRNGYERLKLLATNCTCKHNPRRCFFHNHNTILIYCNLTDTMIWKSTHGKLKYFADLYFKESEKTPGNIYLAGLNGVNVHSLSVAHAKANLMFNQMNG